jgi:two-component system, LuxR family, response regulator FixJ
MSASSGPVLVVDDDAAVRQSLKFSLGLEGLDVRVYESAQDLLAEREIPPHACLVLDYQMPAMNGLELLAELRSRHVAAPAILIAGGLNQDLRRRALSAGVSAVLEKPLSDSSLVDRIRTALASPA